MNELEDKHIVQFITSFQWGTEEDMNHYLLFEWADGGNLDDFWKLHDPERSASFMKWVIEQLFGLATALSRAHNLGDDANYRHGDLKPGNILWFRGGAYGSGHGTLKIGDWGEAKIHLKNTRLRHENTTGKSSTTRYEPPETGLQRSQPEGARHVRSRLYDLWGMGCIILEFVIWLLHGSKELRKFNESFPGDDCTSESFYHISHHKGATIHPIVIQWMEHMAKDGMCIPRMTALGDLLQVVRTGLLVVQLPKDSVSETQPDIGPPQTGDATRPSISITGPGPTSSVVVPNTEEEKGKRFHAHKLEIELRLIMERRAGESYWHQDKKPRPPPVNTFGSSDLLGPNTGRKVHEEYLGLPPNAAVDYAHPPLDPTDWKHENDNDSVTKLLGKIEDIPIVHPSQTPSSSRLCTICKAFGPRLLETEVAIPHETRALRTNAQNESCDLCCLLWRTFSETVNERCEQVRFQRVGSTLRVEDTKHPVLTVLKIDGKSPIHVRVATLYS